MGAGILPTTIQNNKLYFLFGKESKFDDTPGWSDFAGGQDNQESPLQTAMREGSEELTGFLGTPKQVKQLLTRFGTYNIDLNERYRTHLFPLQYDPALCFYYNNQQEFLQQKIYEPLMKDIIKNHKLFEKAEIEWICVDDLMKRKNTFRLFYQDMIPRLLDQRHRIEAFVKKALTKQGEYKKTPSKNKTRKKKYAL